MSGQTAIRASDAELERYMRSKDFARRVKKMQRLIRGRMDRGEKWTFDEIAEGLKLPVDVVVGGFQHSMLKATGEFVVPVAALQ